MSALPVFLVEKENPVREHRVQTKESSESMSTQIVPFLFDDFEVRVVSIDGDAWFVARDVATVLGYSDVTNAIKQHCRGVAKHHPIVDRLGRKQEVRVIGESDVLRMIVSSRLPAAEHFERWVFEEVLPEIRRTGSYNSTPALPQGQELLALAVVEAQALLAQKDEQIATLAPKAEYVDTFVADSDLRLLRNVAKSVGVSESVLRNDLIDRKWIYAEKTTRWSEREQAVVPVTRYSAYSHKAQYFSPVPNHEAPRFKGELMHTLKVTPQGALAIARMYGVKEMEIA